jgi:formate dehydrogenase major subunit
MALFDTIRRHVGLVPNPLSARTRTLQPRIAAPGVGVSVSVCPYCAVGCSQLVYAKDNKVINIEGNYASPINDGTLCPKGSATAGLVNSPYRVLKVKYRAPRSDRWEEKPLAWAVEQIAQRVKATRDAHYQATDNEGRPLNRTLAIGHLGGATLDNEENYLIRKLLTAGLGIVAVENQARI